MKKSDQDADKQLHVALKKMYGCAFVNELSPKKRKKFDAMVWRVIKTLTPTKKHILLVALQNLGDDDTDF